MKYCEKAKLDDTYRRILESLNFAGIGSEYLGMYHYTILKCINQTYKLACGIKLDSCCFDHCSLKNRTPFYEIRKILYSKKINIDEFINCAILPFLPPNSFEVPSQNNVVVYSSLTACYLITATVVSFLLDEGKIDKNNDGNTVVYLPIEQDCTLGYFIGRYIEHQVLHPETTAEYNDRENAKKEYYYNISKINQSEDTDSMFQSEIYSHSKKINDNMRDILKRHLMLGESEDFSAYTYNDIVLMLYKLESENTRVHKVVESPSSETMPFLGYSALRQKTAQISGDIFEHLPTKIIYEINSNCSQTYFEVNEIIRQIYLFAEALYFGNKQEYFEEFIELLRSNISSITIDSIPTLIESFTGVITEPQNPFEELINCTSLLKLASFVKETRAILHYIIENSSTFTTNVPIIHDKYYIGKIFPMIIQESKQYLHSMMKTIDYEMTTLGIPENVEEQKNYIDSVYRIYKNLWGPVIDAPLIDHMACTQIIKSIKDKRFKNFNCLNFYGRRTRKDGIFRAQYNRESQNTQTLSSMISHDKFTTEDCMLIMSLIDTQKYCFFNIDIFSVYKEILKVLDVLDYVLTADNLDYAKSPFRHLRAGEAVLNEWGKVIPGLADYFNNTLKIPVTGMEELEKLRF